MKGIRNDQILLALGCFVALIWGIGAIVQSLFPDHPAPDGVGQVMLIVAGGLFGGSFVTSIRKRNGKDDE